jgi:hypothetical protein
LSIPLFYIPLLSFGLFSLIPKILYGCPRVLSLLTSNLFIFSERRSIHRIGLRVNLFTEYLVLVGTIGSLSVDGTWSQSADNWIHKWQLLSSRKLRNLCEEGTPILRLMAESKGGGDLARQQHHVFLCVQGPTHAFIVHQYTL